MSGRGQTIILWWVLYGALSVRGISESIQRYEAKRLDVKCNSRKHPLQPKQE